MKKQYLVFLLAFIALLPILIFRDYTPDNELKYLSIAQESIDNSNIFAFYNHGQAYADKPPLYLWIAIIGKLLFGNNAMFFMSLFSIIPAFVTIWVMNKWVREEKGELQGFNAHIMLLSSAFFLACSFVLRMDMLMTMFIVLSLYTFFRMYKHNTMQFGSKKQYNKWSILFPVYTFLAIFSKGAVGIMVPLMSVAVFLAVKKNFKTIGKYIGLKFWGILIIFCLCWFTGVYLDGGSEYLNNLLFHQTVNRAVNSFHHKEPFYYYAITYWYAIAPWSIAVAVAVFIGFYKKLVKDNIEIFFAIASLGTIIMMSAISSKIVIYLLPSFPFLLYFGALMINKIGFNKWIAASIIIPSVIFILAFVATFFINKYVELPQLIIPVEVLGAILFIAGVCSIYFICKKDINKSIICISTSLYVLIFVGGLSINKLNSIIGLRTASNYAIEMGKEMKQLTDKEPEIAYYDFRAGPNLDVYFGKEVKSITKEDLANVKNTIMFVKKRDFTRDSVLINTMGDKPRMDFGEFSVVRIDK